MAKNRIYKIIFSFSLFFILNCVGDSGLEVSTLRLSLGQQPKTLHPLVATDVYTQNVNNFIFETLIDFDRDTFDTIPKLATSWEISADNKKFTFHLRHDVKWHDGQPFTADDVVFTANLFRGPQNPNPNGQVYYGDVEDVIKVDEDTVQFVYKKIYFKGFSICGTMEILPKHLLKNETDHENSDFNDHPIGTGPYRFLKQKRNHSILLEKNSYYWGPQSNIEKILFKIVSDSAIAIQLIKKEGLDYLGEVRVIQWLKQTNSLKFNQKFRKMAYPGKSYSYVAWNNQSPFFSDKRVRKAMTLMIDRQKIIEKMQHGIGKVATGPFYPFGKQHNSLIKPYPYNPNYARKLLEEAGWKDSDGDGFLDKNGKKFSFVFLVPSESKFSERLATILKESLEKVGIEMKISQMEWNALLEKVYTHKKFDATIMQWELPVESDPYQLWHSSLAFVPNSSNYIGYQNKDVDELLEQARAEFDEDKRNAIYHRFHKILHEEQPYTFLNSSPILDIISQRIENVVIHKYGVNPLEWRIKQP